MVGEPRSSYRRSVNDTIESPPPPPPDSDTPPPIAAATEPVIGGVCATLADRLGIDALWIRIGFVILAVTSGVGLLAYLGLWLALVAGPRRGSTFAVVVGGFVLLLAVLGFAPFMMSVPWILTGTILSPGALTIFRLLAGIAIALWQPRRIGTASSYPPPGAPPPAPGAAPVDVDGSADWPWSRRVDAPPRPPRPRSALGPLTLGAALLIVALGALVDQVNGGRLHPEQWLGAGAIVCGVGLLVGIVRGRARWLIVPALTFAATGFLGGEMARMDIGLSDLGGDRWIFPAPAGEGGAPRAQVGVGGIVVQADSVSTIEGVTGQLAADVRVAVGNIQIYAPEHLAIDIRAVDGTRVTGYGLQRTGDTYRAGAGGEADVVIDAWVGVGSVQVLTVWAHPDDSWEAEGLPADGVVDMGSLTWVSDSVRMTDDGWFVLGEGEAVIDDTDQLVVGDWDQEGNGVTRIYTMWGDFQLLPRGLLVTPTSEILDLQALRPATPGPADDGTAPGDGTAPDTEVDPTLDDTTSTEEN